MILVYDVANRESFDALPRWYSELETYVHPKVVKMVVGNKVDKVRPYLMLWPSREANRPVQEYSRQVTYSEGQHFATRMGSLFFEASAKTSLGVGDAFKEVVRQVVQTPELIGGGDKVGKPAGPGVKPGATSNRTQAAAEMPGTISLDDDDTHDGYNPGCAC